MKEKPLGEDLLSILACPYCKEKVELKGEFLVCQECGREYPIIDRIPNMLPDGLREEEK